MSLSYDDPLTPSGRPSEAGKPTWEAANLLPLQGSWTEAEYLVLESRDGGLVELVDGRWEVLKTPTLAHQPILAFVYSRLTAFVAERKLGIVAMAPCPIRLSSDRFREPDVFFLRGERVQDLHTPPDGVDLAVEVVSTGEEDRRGDLVEKRADYARAGVSEYWIVDPLERLITVPVLDGAAYRLEGEYRPGQTARSKLLSGLEIDVAAVFAAAELPGQSPTNQPPEDQS